MSARELLKSIVRGIAQIATAPVRLSFVIRAGLLGRDRALQGSSQLVALVPGLVGQYVRRAVLQQALGSCHHSAVIEFGAVFSRAGARLDENTYIGPGCHLGLVHVERDVLIAAGVHIPSGQSTHGIDDVGRPIREQAGAERMVRIGAGAWIGENAVVMADVGHGAVVGAGAVVTRPVPAWSIVAGVPARVVRMRGDQNARAV